MNKAVFIDKDGTLIKDIPFNINPALVCFDNYVVEALQKIQQLNYLLVIVSNQSGISKGFFSKYEVELLFEFLIKELGFFNVKIHAYYYCPHDDADTVSEECVCRKPKPGMLLQASKDLDIDLQNSFMIGDILNDAEAGNSAGCKSILIDNGNETEWFLTSSRMPFAIVPDLKVAADLIISHDKHKCI